MMRSSVFLLPLLAMLSSASAAAGELDTSKQPQDPHCSIQKSHTSFTRRHIHKAWHGSTTGCCALRKINEKEATMLLQASSTHASAHGMVITQALVESYTVQRGCLIPQHNQPPSPGPHMLLTVSSDPLHLPLLRSIPNPVRQPLCNVSDHRSHSGRHPVRH